MSEMDWAEIPTSVRCKEQHTVLGHPDVTHRCRRGDDHEGAHLCKQGHVWSYHDHRWVSGPGGGNEIVVCEFCLVEKGYERS